MRNALRVTGIYAGIVGILLLVPSWAAAAFGYPVKDAAVTSGWGTSVIGIGLLALAASSDAAKHAGLGSAFAAGLVITALDLAYFWMSGAYAARNVLVPIVLNAALAAWIWRASRQGTRP